MSNLSTEALMVAIRSIVRDQARMEQALEDLDSESEAAAELGDDILQSIKVLGELNDVYDDARAKQPQYPSFEGLEASSLENAPARR